MRGDAVIASYQPHKSFETPGDVFQLNFNYDILIFQSSQDRTPSSVRYEASLIQWVAPVRRTLIALTVTLQQMCRLTARRGFTSQFGGGIGG